MKERNVKSNSGITLVALVITIIVLLILAGVSISLVIGDNGVLKQATEASKKQNKSAQLEYVEIQKVFYTEGDNMGDVNLAETKTNIESGNQKDLVKSVTLVLEDPEDAESKPLSLTIEFKDGEKVSLTPDGKVEKIE